MKRNEQNQSQLSFDFNKNVDTQIIADQEQALLQEASKMERIDRDFRRLWLYASIALIFAHIIF